MKINRHCVTMLIVLSIFSALHIFSVSKRGSSQGLSFKGGGIFCILTVSRGFEEDFKKNMVFNRCKRVNI